MRKYLLAFILISSTVFLYGQSEYANFNIGSETYEVSVNEEVIASMDAGSFVLLGPTDGKGQGFAIMIPNSELGDYELNGGYTAPMVSIAVSNEESYNVVSGTLSITNVADKTYEGHFVGMASKFGESSTIEVKGEFKVKLDM